MIPSEPEGHGSDDDIRRVVRFGRTIMYRLARGYRVTNGRSGTPVVKIGRKIRASREELEETFGVPIRFIPYKPVVADDPDDGR